MHADMQPDVCRESSTFVDQAEVEAMMTPVNNISVPNLHGQQMVLSQDDTSSLILSLLGPSHRNDITIIGPDDETASNSTSGHVTRTTADIAALGSTSMPPFPSFQNEDFDPQRYGWPCSPEEICMYTQVCKCKSGKNLRGRNKNSCSFVMLRCAAWHVH